MDNEINVEKTWLKKNWKWLMPVSGMLLICILFVSSIDGNFSDFAQAYSDTSLCQKAIDKTNKNERVIEILGRLEPIDKLAIMEGNAKYSNKGNSVEMTIRVTGNKGKAKMDFSADKNGQNWDYKNIKIRIKKTGEEIQILK